MILTKEQLHDALVERHGAEIQKKLDGATVGIAGLGGLGSNLAVFLARLGIGHMILVDFDVVDITNLNRQHYTMKDLGVPKTLALVEQLEAINPYLNYETYTERVIPANVKHWHGAKKNSWFSHLAMEVPGEDCSNEWCEPVTDEEYAKL